MTQVARVFVVLNLLLAAGFLFSVGTILSLNDHWKSKYETEKADHETTRTNKDREIATITSERDDLRRANEALNEKNATIEGTNSGLRTQVDSLTADNRTKDTANNDLRQKLDNLAATNDRQQKAVERLMTESKENADAARKANARAEQANSDLKKSRDANRDLTNKNDAQAEEINGLNEKVKELDLMVEFARHKGINFENLVKQNPVEGHVLRADNSTRLAVINIGKKGGVERGYTLSITRGGTFIGRLEIDSVYDGAAAGTIKLLAPGQQVQSGDRVTTTLD